MYKKLLYGCVIIALFASHIAVSACSPTMQGGLDDSSDPALWTQDLYLIDIDSSATTNLTDDFPEKYFSWQEIQPFSPDGSSLLVFTYYHQTEAINLQETVTTGVRKYRIMDSDGSNVVEMDDSISRAFWAPNGKITAFSQDGDNHIISLMNADGSNVTEICSLPTAPMPSQTIIGNGGTSADGYGWTEWNSDGTRLAFHHGENIYITDADGSNLTQVTNYTQGSRIMYLHWSPDGTMLAYANRPITGSNRDYYIQVIDTSGTQVRSFTTYESGCDMKWSPDSSSIAYIQEDDSKTYLCIGHINSGQVAETLTDGSLRVDDCRWSPDGSKIVFSGGRLESFDHGDIYIIDIYVIDTDGTNLTNLTSSQTKDCKPKYSPDGTRIAFISTMETDDNEDGYFFSELYVMNTDGSNKLLLSEENHAEGCFHWSPDSTQILAILGSPPE